MAHLGHHCPFLNRADERCSAHFRLDHLGDAFEHCFDRYHACPIYEELLLERQVRRAEAALRPAVGGPAAGAWAPSGSIGSRHAPAPEADRDPQNASPVAGPFVRLTVAHRHPQHAAAGSDVPPVPRL